MKRQSKASRLDESLGERRGKESTKRQSLSSRRHESEGARKPKRKTVMKTHEYKTPEARAGHRYNISKKHREAESRGMKKAMRGR